MSKVTKREGILAKIEGTPGVDAEPVAANDSIQVGNIGWSFAGARMHERSRVSPSLGKLKPIFGGTLMEMTFDVELKGSLAAGTPPEIGPLLRACGFGETIVASTSVTYAGISTGFEYLTMYYYEDGSLYKILGAQGNPEFNFETGSPGMAAMTFTGHVVGPIDAALPAFVVDTHAPPSFINAAFSTGGYASTINALSFGPGNQISTPPSANAADGYGRIQIVDRDYGGSFDPEAELVATDDPIGDWKGGISKAISAGPIGGAGNRWALSIPDAYYREVGPGDRDGVRVHELGYMADGEDAAFSLAFT